MNARSERVFVLTACGAWYTVQFAPAEIPASAAAARDVQVNAIWLRAQTAMCRRKGAGDFRISLEMAEWVLGRLRDLDRFNRGR